MSLVGQALGLVALVPAMVGPVEGQAEQPLLLALCSGGSIAIEVGGPLPPDRATPGCCAKGCRSRDKRRKIDRGQ